MENRIYTIGHSTQSTESFIDNLKKHGINCIVDVRSVPYSRYAEQFNEDNIRVALNKMGIAYIGMGEEFGARRKNKELYDENGKLDFAKTINDDDFLRGVERIKSGMAKDYRISLMCTEKDPQDCHRCILVGRALKDILGADVQNILIDGSLRSQKEIEEALIDTYFPNRDQISLFDQECPDEEEYTDRAYMRRAEDIAYSI